MTPASILREFLFIQISSFIRFSGKGLIFLPCVGGIGGKIPGVPSACNTQSKAQDQICPQELRSIPWLQFEIMCFSERSPSPPPPRGVNLWISCTFLAVLCWLWKLLSQLDLEERCSGSTPRCSACYNRNRNLFFLSGIFFPPQVINRWMYASSKKNPLSANCTLLF